MSLRIFLAITWGLLIGCMTFLVGSIAAPSHNPIIETMKIAVMIIIIPGLYLGAAISGNIHAFDLGPCALVNAVIQFGLSWLLFPLLMRFKRVGRS